MTRTLVCGLSGVHLQGCCVLYHQAGKVSVLFMVRQQEHSLSLRNLSRYEDKVIYKLFIINLLLIICTLHFILSLNLIRKSIRHMRLEILGINLSTPQCWCNCHMLPQCWCNCLMLPQCRCNCHMFSKFWCSYPLCLSN